jgi:pheromone shutdown protein TraB
MVWWVLFLAVLSILSYLADVGVLPWLSVRVPFLGASLLSVLILLSAAGILARVLVMRRRGKREAMEKRIRELEKKLGALGAAPPLA